MSCGCKKKNIKEATSTSSSGEYITPLSWEMGGDLTRDDNKLVSTELYIDLPDEVMDFDGDIQILNLSDILSPTEDEETLYDDMSDYDEFEMEDYDYNSDYVLDEEIKRIKSLL